MAWIIEKEEYQRRCLNCNSLVRFYWEEIQTGYTEWEPAIFDPENYHSYEVRDRYKYIICPNCGGQVIFEKAQEVREV